MRFNERDAIALASMLLSHDKQMEMHRNLFLSPVCENPDMVDFANARDYFLINLVDIVAGKNLEEAKRWLPTIEALVGVSSKANDKFYEGFFFALHEFLRYDFKIDDGSGHSLNRDLLKESLKLTLEKVYKYQAEKAR
jgi:hypothetical protein